jgi:hypothetical protein
MLILLYFIDIFYEEITNARKNISSNTFQFTSVTKLVIDSMKNFRGLTLSKIGFQQKLIETDHVIIDLSIYYSLLFIAQITEKTISCSITVYSYRLGNVQHSSLGKLHSRFYLTYQFLKEFSQWSNVQSIHIKTQQRELGIIFCLKLFLFITINNI